MGGKYCWLCGANGSADPLDKHHIFNGPYRAKSDQYGLTVYLCHANCHIFGVNAAHVNPYTRRMLQQWGQRKAMADNNWTVAQFAAEFGRDYLDDTK